MDTYKEQTITIKVTGEFTREDLDRWIAGLANTQSDYSVDDFCWVVEDA